MRARLEFLGETCCTAAGDGARRDPICDGADAPCAGADTDTEAAR